MNRDEFDFMMDAILDRIVDVLKSKGLIDNVDERYIHGYIRYECWKGLKDRES